MARRGATDLSGILALDKPAGMTSHDVVSVVRRVTGERRVGHAGTLDPSATGVLVVLVGPATRLAPYLTAARKSYDARIVFGTETDTDDEQGTPTRTASVPQHLADPEVALTHVSGLMGVHFQVPPAFSAIKRDGVVAHRAARAGHDIDLEPRRIEVREARLLGVEPGPPLAWNVALDVSKGTYIRAIARDLGRTLGTTAHLDGLRRTRSGEVRIARTIPLATLETLSAEEIAQRFMPAIEALGLPVVVLDEDDSRSVAVGRSIDVPPSVGEEVPDGARIALEVAGRLAAIYERSGSVLKPATVIPGGVM